MTTLDELKLNQLVKKLHDLHETRKQMKHHSIYHSQYVDLATELNIRIKNICGKDYQDLTQEEIRLLIVSCITKETTSDQTTKT